jgi:hypothetical protein
VLEWRINCRIYFFLSFIYALSLSDSVVTWAENYPIDEIGVSSDSVFIVVSLTARMEFHGGLSSVVWPVHRVAALWRDSL